MEKKNNKSAILLPLFGRKLFTERFLNYYENKKCNYTFYISDGSKVPQFTQSYLNEKFQNLNIIYIRFGYDKNYKTFIKKMYNTIKLIDCNYIYICTNDDFFNIDFIRKAEFFLNNNKDYVSVLGKIFNFKIFNYLKIENDYGYFKGIYLQYNNYTDISSNVVLERVKLYNKYYFYESLTRKKILLDNYKLAIQYNADNYIETKWFFNLLPLIKGKVKFLKMISLLRQSNTYFSEGQGLFYTRVTAKKYQHFVNFLKNKLKLTDNILLNFLKNENIEVDSYQINFYKKFFFYYFLKVKLFFKSITNVVVFLFFRNYSNDKYNALYKNINKWI